MMKEAWYPLATSERVPKHGICAVSLFGEPLVLFRDSNGQPVCLQDRCPHRSTPLSLGRLTEGRLECRYHGWQFTTGGRCARIPSQPPDVVIPERANATHRPCIEQRGAVWVWAGEALQADQQRMPASPFEVLDEPGMCSYVCETTIDVPHELMVENLLDPAHAPFTHHGTMSRRSLAQPIRLEDMEGSRALLAGRVRFDLKRHALVPALDSVELEFHPPCAVSLQFFGVPKNGRPVRTYQLQFCVPLSRGKMKLVSFYAAPFPKMLRSWMKPMFEGMANKVIRQDIGVLQGQQRAFELGAPAFNQAVGADRLTLRYRQWLRENLTDSLWFTEFCAQARGSTNEVSLRSVGNGRGAA